MLLMSCTQLVGWKIVLSDEVGEWYASLGPRDLRIVDELLGRLSEQGSALEFPRARQLGSGLHELRCKLGGGTVQRRITYVFDLDRHVVTLMTFRKQRDNERKQILRARRAQASREWETRQ